MKVFKLTPGKGNSPCVESDIRNLNAWFEDAEPGDVYTVEVLYMTEDEYSRLPEYMGP